MTAPASTEKSSGTRVLLGDEAVAQAAIDSGISVAYAYPGTPSTEILEYLVRNKERHGRPHAAWTANEKTSLEEALGASIVGRRAMVSMKHVGLNVAADPFVNAAIVDIGGGLVVTVADDPGMHSSQNEQDSRFYADFARIVCFEPADQQQAYAMTREAFDVSERFKIPVMIRLVTRLAHSRAVVELARARGQNEISKPENPSSWVLLPSNSRKQWRKHLDRLPEIQTFVEESAWNPLELAGRKLGVVTTGIARNYFLENVAELDERPSHLHIGAYPAPVEKLRQLAAHVDEVLVIEDGYPLVERALRGVLPQAKTIRGKLSGDLPDQGELDPDVVRESLGLAEREGLDARGFELVSRPPQLCAGCSHRDSFAALQKALEGYEDALVTSDIGCYTLGALPPYNAIESCVCMGSSVGMAKGAAESGFHPVVAVLGDSTFLHSGVTPLMDAVDADANMTLMIVDNKIVAMTGAQPTIMPSQNLKDVVLGMGVHPEHLHVIDAHPRKVDEMAEVIRREIEHEGLSVVITVRECIEAAKRRKKQEKKG